MNLYEKLWREAVGLGPTEPVPDHSLDLTLRSFNVDRSLSWVMRREVLVRRYAWAVPTDEALDELAKHAPLVEMGAGTGYWASLLRARGVDVIAYDKTPVGNPELPNPWHSEREGLPLGAKIVPFTEVLCGAPAVLAQRADRSLFLCWPPYSDPMAYDSLMAWEGKTLVLVAEGTGGATADEPFWERLDELFECVAHVRLPQWPGLHDVMTVWRRRRC